MWMSLKEFSTYLVIWGRLVTAHKREMKFSVYSGRLDSALASQALAEDAFSSMHCKTMGEVLVFKYSSVIKCQFDPVCDSFLAGLLVTTNQLPVGSWPAAPLPRSAYWPPFWSEENILVCFQVQGFWICSFHTSQAPFMKWASISGMQDKALYC